MPALRRLYRLARPVYLVEQGALVRLAAVRVAALHFEGLLGARSCALLLLLLAALACVGVALEQLVLGRVLVLGQDWVVSRLLCSIVLGEVHNLVRVHACIVRAYLLLIALCRIEAGLVHHLVEACRVEGLPCALGSGLGRLSMVRRMPRVVKYLLNYLVKLETIVLWSLLLGLFGLRFTLVLSFRRHILQDYALVVGGAVLILLIHHGDRCIELVEVYVVASGLAWRWIRAPAFRMLRRLLGRGICRVILHS